LMGEGSSLGQIDLAALERLLETHRTQVNYITVTGASNVTGIVNPIPEIAALAHAYGAWIVVDGSQWVAHAPVRMVTPENPVCNIDFLVFSGHKVYAPGSPGVVVGRRDIFEAVMIDEMGGGTVDNVSLASFDMTRHLPERLEPGTPNIVGAVLLACVLEILHRIGMDYLQQREHQLVRKIFFGLSKIRDVTLYGATDVETTERVGAIAFNLKGLDHGLVAAVLNDYYNVAVRNECFCAHPYVRELLLPELWDIDLDKENSNPADLLSGRRGMLRASLALYTTEEDVEALLRAIGDILARRDYYSSLYMADRRGNYHHLHYRGSKNTHFTPLSFLDTLLRGDEVYKYSDLMPAAICS
jgi:cysteine desulfurase / selenocysteine lyase